MNRNLLLPFRCLVATATIGVAAAAPTIRARDYSEALEQAKASGNDIVVLQRGSDWNHLGEKIYQNAWQQAAFLAALGDGFILTTVDRPEQAGAPAVGSSGDPMALRRFLESVSPTAPLPATELGAITAEGGGRYTRRDDGTLCVDDPKNEHNPAGDTLTLSVTPRHGGNLLRLDFPPDASLPKGCAGRAPNGNFVISEVAIRFGDQAIATTHAWANAAEGAMGAGQTIDGIKDQPGNGWNAAAHLCQRRTLMLVLAKPVRAGHTLQVTLTCKPSWGQHVPGSLRATVINDPNMAMAIENVGNAESLATRNASFSWWATGTCPRIALLDSEGRAIDAENHPRSSLTPATLASRIKQLRDKRLLRDEWLVKAEAAQGPAKAEMLRQALVALGIGNSPGNGNCYQVIHQKIKEADPNDVSGVTRWLGFSADPRGGVPWAKPAWSEAIDSQGGKRTLTDTDYQLAIARVDKELADPRNRILSHENIQRMMVAKFHIYRNWKGHQDERFQIQQEIARFDPDTFWGIGATGYLGMYGKSAVPFVTYGWKPEQVRPGLNQWPMTDTAYYFDHPGSYKITLSHTAGPDTVKVKRLALLDGSNVIAEVKPDQDLKPGAKCEAMLDCHNWQAERNYKLVAEIEATADHTNVQGRFSVEPWFIEAPAKSAGPALADPAKVLLELRDKLNSGKSDPRDLARHELLRRCGVESIRQLTRQPQGAAFLTAFTSDLDWLESFLANDECLWPQAIDNLRFLYANAKRDDFIQPLYRRLATAIAMAAGDMNRHNMLERYRDIIRVHREGLLHASFDQLSVREMRWAVLLSGSAAEYQFLVDATQVRVADYLGACWGLAYIDPNAYGYSVQGWGYIDPWTHHYGTGTGDRPFRAHHHVGGVCGTLSGYGAVCARAHGVMSTTVGQPGHCAYVVRIGQEWPTGYDVSGPETNGMSVYEGTGFPTVHRLYEVIHAEHNAYLQACRLAWAAHAAQDRRNPTPRVASGIRYSIYQIPGGTLSEISKSQPIATGSTDSFDLAPILAKAPKEDFVIVWDGRLEVMGSGKLLAQVHTPNNARLVVDQQVIAPNKPPVMVNLKATQCPVRLEYGQGKGQPAVAVNWSGMPAWDSQWADAWSQALSAQPINYPLWLEWIKLLENAADLPTGMWQKSVATIAPAFAPYHEAGWALINRCYAKAATAMSPQERMTLLLKCHRCLTQTNAPKFMGYNLGAVLNAQADSLGDPAMELEFLSQLLKVHFTTDPKSNRVFGDVMNWGNTRFSGKPATASAYARVIGGFFANLGSKADPNQMRSHLTAGVRKASEAGDAAAYQLWMTMAAKLLPAVQPAEIHLTPEQLAAPPKATPFPGILLGKDGILQTSSACQYDRPLSYRAVLDGSSPGYFDTNNEATPWAQITLAGDADLSGVVIVNRFELPPTHGEFMWAAPLKLSISTDGKIWREVATIEQAEPVMRVDLTGKATRARYLKIERLTPAGTPPGRFHLRNILVFGRKLY